MSDRLASFPMMRVLITAAIAVTVLATSVALANLSADAASTGLPTAERDEVVALAREHWDNPFQRLVFRAFGVSRRPDTGGAVPAGRCEDALAGVSSRTWAVTAYTFLGLPVARALVTCDGSVTSLEE